MNLALHGQAVSEEKMFEIVDNNKTTNWTPEHGYTISSPCEPDGSGELNFFIFIKNCFFLLKLFVCFKIVF